MATFNSITLAQFKEKNSVQSVDVVRNPNNNMLFFTFGDQTGYISKNLREKIDNGEALGTIYFSYVDEPTFTGWMMHSGSNNTVMSL
jgi:hypothetical protein